VERGIKDPLIHIEIDQEEDMSVVRVKDNAGGIEEEVITRIFEPYFSTKKGSGTGLGLYMSKMIIEENMEGELSVCNDTNGALFTIKVKHER
jgi:C4-dicarboxylate-specific signal transduction histidine kinase